jgi:hypothetical protein
LRRMRGLSDEPCVKSHPKGPARTVQPCGVVGSRVDQLDQIAIAAVADVKETSVNVDVRQPRQRCSRLTWS